MLSFGHSVIKIDESQSDYIHRLSLYYDLYLRFGRSIGSSNASNTFNFKVNCAKQFSDFDTKLALLKYSSPWETLPNPTLPE